MSCAVDACLGAVSIFIYVMCIDTIAYFFASRVFDVLSTCNAL